VWSPSVVLVTNRAILTIAKSRKSGYGSHTGIISVVSIQYQWKVNKSMFNCCGNINTKWIANILRCFEWASNVNFSYGYIKCFRTLANICVSSSSGCKIAIAMNEEICFVKSSVWLGGDIPHTTFVSPVKEYKTLQKNGVSLSTTTQEKVAGNLKEYKCGT